MNATANRNSGQAHNIIEIGSPHSSPFSFFALTPTKKLGEKVRRSSIN
jgi:hypothetical protein